MWCRIPRLYRTSSQFIPRIPYRSHLKTIDRRGFHYSPSPFVVKPFFLADIGEGIRECEVIQWFVETGARVEQFDKLCEVQSDKASVEITSRYDGVIKKLYYEAGDMAIVGKPLVDIDIQGDVEIEEPAAPAEVPKATPEPPTSTPSAPPQRHTPASSPPSESISNSSGAISQHNTLATPAVRRICKEHNIDISQVRGTGKDGRVLKEDVMNFIEEESSSASTTTPTSTIAPAATATTTPPALLEEKAVPLTPIQSQMFKTMTRSLSIPHFLFSDEVKLDPLIHARAQLNKKFSSTPITSEQIPKITYMPFFIKAMSLALSEYPIVNSRVEIKAEGGRGAEKPNLIMRPQHNIGVAMDTPSGLIVPNIKNVQNLSIMQIAKELSRLQVAGKDGKLTPFDLQGGTITISNIGNIGGTVVSPVIVSTEVAILGIGQAKKVPAFDNNGQVVPTTIVNFSWSADHRVIDGATMARMGTLMKELLEGPEFMLVRMN